METFLPSMKRNFLIAAEMLSKSSIDFEAEMEKTQNESSSLKAEIPLCS